MHQRRSGQCNPSGCPTFCLIHNCYGEFVTIWFDEQGECVSESLN